MAATQTRDENYDCESSLSKAVKEAGRWSSGHGNTGGVGKNTKAKGSEVTEGQQPI